MNTTSQTINISVPKYMMQDIKDMIAAGHFATISEVFRAGVNKVKLELHPKYYKEVKISAKAERRLKRAEADLRAGKYVTVKSFTELLD